MRHIGTDLRRGAPEPPAEGTIEMRKVAEADGKCDGADGAIAIGVEHFMCPGNALGEYVFQEREALGLKQHVHVARADAEMGRDGLRSQIGPVQVPPHERLGGDQSCRAHPAALGGRGRVARRPERKGKTASRCSSGVISPCTSLAVAR